MLTWPSRRNETCCSATFGIANHRSVTRQHLQRQANRLMCKHMQALTWTVTSSGRTETEDTVDMMLLCWIE